MKKGKSIIFTAGLLIVLSIVSCNKKLVPVINPGKSAKNEAAYNLYFVEAVKQKLLGNAGDALNLFEQCLIFNPESDACYFQMAQIVMSNGDINNGKKYIRKAAVMQPGNLYYQMILASIYYKEKDLDSAIYCYENAMKANPEKEDLQIFLANLYTENKKFEKARNLLDKFDEKYGVNEKTTLSLISNLMAEKKYNEALEKVMVLIETDPDEINYNGLLAEIYRSKGDNEKASDVYKKLIERNPDNPAIQLSVCDFLFHQKNYNELFVFLNSVLLNSRISKEEKISFMAELMDSEDILNSYGKNLEIMLMILEANYKNDDVVLLMRPEFLEKEKKLDEAAQRLEELIAINRNNYFAWEKLLMVYYNMKDFNSLEKRGEECATMFNRSVLAKMLYATAAMENRKYDVAIEELRKCDILSGDNKEMKMQILTMRADIYYRMKDFEKAFNIFDEAIKIDNSDITVMNNYAYYLAEQNMRLKEAEKMAKIVITKEKDNTTYLDTYAWVLYKRGKVKEASKIMERIIGSGEKEDAEWYEHYGFILKKRGKCKDAVEKWKTAISIDKSKIHLQKEIENCEK